jgi:hypothetical protein
MFFGDAGCKKKEPALILCNKPAPVSPYKAGLLVLGYPKRMQKAAFLGLGLT